MVTPALFDRYPDARALAAARPAAVERLVASTGFFRQKTRALRGMARQLVEQHGGQVPADMNALTELPGVGRKTANVVLGHALGVPGLPVDRHVLRVAARIGLAAGTDPVKESGQIQKSRLKLFVPKRNSGPSGAVKQPLPSKRKAWPRMPFV